MTCRRYCRQDPIQSLELGQHSEVLEGFRCLGSAHQGDPEPDVGDAAAWQGGLLRFQQHYLLMTSSKVLIYNF